MRVLAGNVQGVALVGARVHGVGGARFDGVGNQAVVDKFQCGDMRGGGKSLVHRCLVAEAPDIAGVVGREFVVHLRRAFFARILSAHHGRQHLVIDFDEFGRIARLVLSFGDDHGDMVADIARLALRQHRVRRLLHRLAVRACDQPAAGQAVDLGGGNVLAGVYGDDTRRLERAVLVNALDFGVRVRRAHECGVTLVRQVDVVGVIARAGEKAIVLAALDALADEFHVTHDQSPLVAPSPLAAAVVGAGCVPRASIYW